MQYAHIKGGKVVTLSDKPTTDCTIQADAEVGCGWLYDGTSFTPSPEQLAANAIASVNANTAAGIAAGYPYAGKVFSASDNHQRWSLGMTLGIAAGQDFAGTVIPTIDDADTYTITDNADGQNMAAACQGFVAQWLASGSALKKQINEATPEQLKTFIDPR